MNLKKSATDSTNTAAFGRILRFWRNVHSISQEELAFRIDSAARHISRLENGDAKPSQEMVNKIAVALGLGKRDRINLLFAAGYVYSLQASDIHLPAHNTRKNEIIQHLKALEPLPAMVQDIVGNIIMVNKPWLGLLKLMVPDRDLSTITNMFDCLFDYADRQVVPQQWQGTLCVLLLSIHQTLLYTQDEKVKLLRDNLFKSSYVPDDWQKLAAQRPPAGPLGIDVLFNNQPETFLTFSQSVGLLGPLTFSTVPEMISTVFHPKNEGLDLTILMDHTETHPFLYG